LRDTSDARARAYISRRVLVWGLEGSEDGGGEEVSEDGGGGEVSDLAPAPARRLAKQQRVLPASRALAHQGGVLAEKGPWLHQGIDTQRLRHDDAQLLRHQDIDAQLLVLSHPPSPSTPSCLDQSVPMAACSH
jgi:hypothetical protein